MADGNASRSERPANPTWTDAMHPRTLLPISLTALIALAACDQGATEADPAGLTREEAAALAPVYDDLSGDDMAAMGAPTFSPASGAEAAAADTTTVAFTRTRTCPQGGSVRVEGTLQRVVDREARSATHRYDAVRTEQSCTFSLRGAGSLTISGNPNTVVTGRWSVTDGTPGIRTLTHVGGFTWTRGNGANGSCTVDLTSTWDPATHTHRVQGTFCGRTVDVTRTRGS